MWQQGWRLLFPLEFPWLQLTILGPGQYSDHHYLFHVLQAPFTQGDLRVGAKMAAVLFGTCGLYTSYLFLARTGVRYPLLWIALLIASAPTFLWRQSMARPQSLFLALLVAAIWAVFAGRPRLLLPLGCLAVWLFDGFPFLLGIPAAAVAAHLTCRLLRWAACREWGRPWRRARASVVAMDVSPARVPGAGTDGASEPRPVDDLQSSEAPGGSVNGVPNGRTALLAGTRAASATVSAGGAAPSERGAADGAVREPRPEADPGAMPGAEADAQACAGHVPPLDTPDENEPDGRGARLAVAALGWAALGVALGLLLHPYAPRNLEFAYLHLLPKAVPSEQLDVPVGQEWNPFSVSGFITRAGLIAALTALGLVPPLLALARRRAPDWRTVMLGGIAVGFMVMTARSQRLIEYFPAFAVLFCAWSWSHTASTSLVDLAWLVRRARTWIRTRLGRRLVRRDASQYGSEGIRLATAGMGPDSGIAALRLGSANTGPGDQATGLPGRSSPSGRVVGWLEVWRPRLAVAWPWLAAAVLAPVLLTSIGLARRDAGNGLAWDTYRDAALWLAANTPAGARVFTTDWDDFPYMFFWNTHNTYLTGLDPTYMSLHDPALYRRWRDVTAGRVREPSRAIRQEFGARYVVSDRQRKHEAFLRAAAADPALEEVLRTPAVVVLRVRDGRD